MDEYGNPYPLLAGKCNNLFLFRISYRHAVDTNNDKEVMPSNQLSNQSLLGDSPSRERLIRPELIQRSAPAGDPTTTQQKSHHSA
jgi:hypothetical protein